MNFSCYQGNGPSTGGASGEGGRTDGQTGRQRSCTAARPGSGRPELARRAHGIPPSHSPHQPPSVPRPTPCLRVSRAADPTPAAASRPPDPSIAHPASSRPSPSPPHPMSCIPPPTSHRPAPSALHPTSHPQRPTSHSPHPTFHLLRPASPRSRTLRPASRTHPLPTWSPARPLTLLRGSLTMCDLLLEMILGERDRRRRRRRRRKVRQGGLTVPWEQG